MADDKEKEKTESNCIHSVNNNDKTLTKTPRCLVSGYIIPHSMMTDLLIYLALGFQSIDGSSNGFSRSSPTFDFCKTDIVNIDDDLKKEKNQMVSSFPFVKHLMG